MRPPTTTCTALLMCFLIATAAFLFPASAQNLNRTDVMQPSNTVPQESAPLDNANALEAKPPLLPVRPKDFDPMQPPTGDDAYNSLAIAHPPVMPSIESAQLSVYMVKLTYYAGLLVFFAFGGVLLLIINIFYLRSNVMQAASLARSARALAESAIRQGFISKD